MEKEGYITVYLSLTIAIMLTFIVTLIEGARVQTIRFQTECVMDIGMTSIFAEYNREFLKQYGLLAIDTSYGHFDADVERTKSHLLQYMNMNFVAPGQNRLPNYKDLTAVHADNADISRVSYLSDNSGEVLKYQIIQYMKEKTGLSTVDSFISAVSIDESNNRYQQLENEKKSNYGQIDEILSELNTKRGEEEEEISIDNPADRIEGMGNNFLLDLVVKDSGNILRNKVTLSDYISHRSYTDGSGVWETQNPPQGAINYLMFQKYLFEKCGYYSSLKENSTLGYQLEYLLYGNDNDFDNLDDFAKQVFKVRYVINAAYLFSCNAKIREAAALAATVTTGIGSPQLTEAVKMTILFAWCYAETIQDLRILFDGSGIAEVKSDSTWNIELSELLMFTSTLDSYHVVSNGKTYQDYLAEFMFIKDEKTIRMRLMDIMEMDIRKTTGNQNFCMDACVYQLMAKVNVSSQYGYGYSITRDYSYE